MIRRNRTLPSGVAALLLGAIHMAVAGTAGTSTSKTDTQPGPVTTISARTMKTGLIAITTLPAETRRPGIPAYGRVVDPTPVIHLHAEIVAARAKAHLAAATLARTQRLYHAAQNVSKARLEQAAADAVETRARLAELTERARLRYGAALGGAIVGDGAAYRRIATGGALISATVTVTGPRMVSAPATARAREPDGTAVPLTLVGEAGRLPGGAVGRPFFFTGPALPAGTPLAVTLTGGKARKGYAVPVSALIWQRGIPHVFVRAGTRRFREMPIPDSAPIRREDVTVAYFVPAASLPASPAIVTTGAGVVFSAAAGPIPSGGN